LLSDVFVQPPCPRRQSTGAPHGQEATPQPPQESKRLKSDVSQGLRCHLSKVFNPTRTIQLDHHIRNQLRTILARHGWSRRISDLLYLIRLTPLKGECFKKTPLYLTKPIIHLLVWQSTDK